MATEINDLMFYQYLHDRDYHHDIHVLGRKDKLNHLIHHLHKYNNSFNNSHTWLEDFLACVLSMAGTMNVRLDKGASNLLLRDVETVDDIGPFFGDEIVSKMLTENLRLLSKTMEGLDHIEEFDYHGVLKEVICKLFIIVFQLNKLENNTSNETFVCRYFERLEFIKNKHCFDEYFKESQGKHRTIKHLRIKFLGEAAVTHHIHADQTLFISSIG